MNDDQLRQIALEVINKEKWWDILSRFIDVLRINIFIVDHQGKILLPPEEAKYGGRLLLDRSMNFDLLNGPGNIMEQFEPQGKYLEAINRFDLHSFAIPINTDGKQIFAYMIVGPVMVNRRMESSQYKILADQSGVSEKELADQLNEIRVVSNLMVNSILDLLSEIVRNNIEVNQKEKALNQIKSGQVELTKEFKDAAQEIYKTVRMDELLATLLDIALKMTNMECGSIMVMDEAKGDLTIKVSRGIDTKQATSTRIKVGEGIAGLAVKENSSFLINGQKSDNNRIQRLLKRPEIKHALVMPLVSKDKVFGVLNIHTKNLDSKVQENFENLQYLAKLLASAF